MFLKVFEGVYLVSPRSKIFSLDSAYLIISAEDILSPYIPFCDDFGPMNLGTVHEFCCHLEDQIIKNQDLPL